MRIVVSGASGFIGGAVAAAAKAAGHIVAAVARPETDAARLSGADMVIRGHLDRPDSLDSALTAFAPEAAIHCAWDGITSTTRDDVAVQAANYAMSLGFLEACRRAGAKAWVGLGSQAEYGIPNRKLDESALPDPVTVYGAVKLAVGQTARVACARAGLRFAWVRVFHVYGPGDNPGFMVPALIDKLLSGTRPAMTAGTQLWDLLHVGDAARALVHLATRPDLAGVFNLGSGDPRTIRRIAEDVRDAVDPALELGFGEIPSHPGGPTHLEADISRLRGTGWAPLIPWAEGIRDTVAWHRARKEQI